MPHASHIHKPADNGLVTLRFSVDSDKVTPGTDEVFISTCAEGVIKVPKSLMKDGKENGYVVFEARVPADVAAAVRSICAELFRLTYTQEEA
jgi:hypothetical protein